MVLPAANEDIRKFALKRSHSNKYKQENWPLVNSYFARILEREVYLAERKLEVKLKVHNDDQMNVREFFDKLTGSKDTLTLLELIKFIKEQSKFEPRQHELEAIMRRCDHDADLCLSEDEFSELFEIFVPIQVPAQSVDMFNPEINSNEQRRHQLIV